jgi:predicted metal-dependent phosphoesterase TrpH
MLKLDLHIHSQYSDDAEGSAKEIIQSLKKKGLQGCAITDHNTVKGGLVAQKLASNDFIVIPGVEISTRDGHLLALNMSTDIPRGLSIEQTIDRVIYQGGIPIVPHVLRNMSGIKVSKLKEIASKLSAMEVFNACSQPHTNIKMAQIAQSLHLGGTGGSDSHIPEYAGYGYTVVDTTDMSNDAICAAIEQKKTWGEGKSLPFSYREDRLVKSIRQFFQRGLKKI